MKVNPNYPTPVELLPRMSRDGRCDLWVKRDDKTHPAYGGNKVRKLERILAEAEARGVRRIVTVGAAGSHQVLATALFAGRAGFEVEGVLLPQPQTASALDHLRVATALGARLFPAPSYAAAPFLLMRRLGRDALYVPVGGSSLAGTSGYVDAGQEIARQVREGVMPEPDVAVVTLGSGGTAAGLAAGFAREGMKTEVLGVAIAPPAWALGLTARWLAWRVGGRRLRLRATGRYLGRGYAHRTAWGDRATMIAAASGLTLDPTYTAKTFAAALDLVDSGRYRHVLYVHTLSSAPLEPLLEGAPPAQGLPRELTGLLR